MTTDSIGERALERVPPFPGEQVRALRRQLSWTQATLAEFLALPDDRYIQAIEHNRKQVSALARLCLRTLKKVAAATPPPQRRALQRGLVEGHEQWFARVLGKAVRT
ncbi:hypothetical protein SAMN02745121_08563 [Nannocystis exedens]|uniref:Helix-turn-helix domain-containing protein n=1 Tax=Nannocystis exedens TaxID=54 RepID=A0A1I2IAE0_9BACT|nr:helix-turn-helix transcriptional regulator [Nannocystis exedens]PCC73148.1 hypothetical protein NAEX_06236 [Nannocystis exedens]SFF39292.1 hypothetical protein SAMN02745121_08563 [Nannocystis exedens]